MLSSDIIATCAAIIAVFAFGVTAWQAWLAYDHNRLSVRPLLVWHIARETLADGLAITYVVKNLGLGPAIIMDRYFTQQGRRFETPEAATDEVDAFVASVLANKVNYQLRMFGLPGRGAAIPSQGEVIIGKIFFPGARSSQLDVIENVAGNINFHVVYESMYRQKFTFNALDGNAS